MSESQIPEPVLDLDQTIDIELDDTTYQATLIFCKQLNHDSEMPSEKWDILVEKGDETVDIEAWLKLDDYVDYDEDDLSI